MKKFMDPEMKVVDLEIKDIVTVGDDNETQYGDEIEW